MHGKKRFNSSLPNYRICNKPCDAWNTWKNFVFYVQQQFHNSHPSFSRLSLSCFFIWLNLDTSFLFSLFMILLKCQFWFHSWPKIEIEHSEWKLNTAKSSYHNFRYQISETKLRCHLVSVIVHVDHEDHENANYHWTITSILMHFLTEIRSNWEISLSFSYFKHIII